MQFLGAAPSDAADLVTKGYADSLSTGGTGNITVSGQSNYPLPTASAHNGEIWVTYTDGQFWISDGTSWIWLDIGPFVPGARVFVQFDDPDTTNPAYTGPAVWFVLNGSGQVIGKKVRV